MPDRPLHQRGQATVEFAVLLPLVCLVLVAGWQLALAGHARWSASAAARAAARARAVGAEPLDAARRALPASLEERVSVSETARGVEVSIRVPAVLPGLDLGSLTAHATFAAQQ